MYYDGIAGCRVVYDRANWDSMIGVALGNNIGGVTSCLRHLSVSVSNE